MFQEDLCLLRSLLIVDVSAARVVGVSRTRLLLIVEVCVDVVVSAVLVVGCFSSCCCDCGGSLLAKMFQE